MAKKTVKKTAKTAAKSGDVAPVEHLVPPPQVHIDILATLGRVELMVSQLLKSEKKKGTHDVNIGTAAAAQEAGVKLAAKVTPEPNSVSRFRRKPMATLAKKVHEADQ